MAPCNRVEIRGLFAVAPGGASLLAQRHGVAREK
jgi:hypothetical protein